MDEKYKQEPTDLVKVVLFGPESTGKTTLSKQLADHYNTVWVPEYAREYLQEKWNRERKTCEPKDLLPIAEGQMQLENAMAYKANHVLICDTDLLETKVYSEAYYLGYCDPLLEKYALENNYDLYILTYIDVPWEADDLRDKPQEREKMFAYFRKTLEKYNRNFIIVKGDEKSRLCKAVQHIEKIRKSDMGLTEKDIEQLKKKGIDQEKVLNQIETFKEGIPFVKLHKAAIIGNGILSFSKTEQENLVHIFKTSREGLSLLKFVPASGAASRMFKALFNFLEVYDPSKESLEAYIKRTDDKAIESFFAQWTKFPFYKEVLSRIAGKSKTKDAEKYLFIQEMMSEDALNYGFYPKGLLPFHDYGKHMATPFEEHLKEAADYAEVAGKANLHFTISEQHGAMFNKEFDAVGNRVSTATNTSFKVSYSFQKASTDTIAVNMDNEPFRNPDGSILFRPGGHGALIENLNEQEADVVFIKNIDNVVTPSAASDVAHSKKVLAGLLLNVQKKAFEYAAQLENDDITAEVLQNCKDFLEKELNVRFSDKFSSFSIGEQIDVLRDKIHRPIRICGMVKNEGEPGGGPFWIQDANGHISLQIIESAQVDLSNTSQTDIFKNSTHFNPVDLVCGIKDYKGEKFNLLNFIDEKQGFITEKTKDGVALKALELPGLWNGAMAYWNTIFVEVPSTTFNPVKTVNDLLKPTHQVT